MRLLKLNQVNLGLDGTITQLNLVQEKRRKEPQPSSTVYFTTRGLFHTCASLRVLGLHVYRPSQRHTQGTTQCTLWFRPYRLLSLFRLLFSDRN